MPRPVSGYKNKAGQPIPGTHDPISRFMDRRALMHWAHGRGSDGLPLYDAKSLDIGTVVHGMCGLDLAGRPDAEINAALNRLTFEYDLRKAVAAFAAFREWRKQHTVEVIAQEVPLVSEQWQYGGTPDVIARVDGEVALLDFKTSAGGKLYPEMPIALAAHGRLWNENHPDKPITSFHLIILPKDGSAFQHHAYAHLRPQWQLFQLYLQAWKIENEVAGITTTAAAVTVIAPRATAPVIATPAARPRTVVPSPKSTLVVPFVGPAEAAAAKAPRARKATAKQVIATQPDKPASPWAVGAAFAREAFDVD
jgi:hypothetical protein